MNPKDIKYIYWFSFYNLDSISARYRGKYVLEHLNSKHNVDYSFVYPSYKLKDIIRFCKYYLHALLFKKKNSLIVIQKVCTNNIYAKALKLLCLIRKKDTLYDIDDAEWVRFPAKNINDFIKKTNKCFVGSNSILNYAREINQKTFLLTSPVISHYVAKEKRNHLFTIGWVGDYTDHYVSLDNYFLGALDKIEFNAKVVLMGVISDKEKQNILQRFKRKKNLQFDIPLVIDWQKEHEIYQKISEFDIGISTLNNNTFDIAKSAFKLKQYLSCGVPAIASNIGENVKFIENGINGYLCNNSEEFHQAIQEVYQLNTDKYSEMSLNALKTYPSYRMDAYCTEFMTNIKTII